MGEHRIIVESGTITAIPGIAAGTNFYTTAIQDVPGVAAANNFLSVLNPVGSGKLITFYGVFVLPWASGAATVAVSMNLFRISAASAGTQITAANIDKFYTGSPNSVADVRISNPTLTTVGNAVGGFPPAITAAADGVTAAPSVAGPSGASFLCAPGEGLALRTASGATTQLWNLGFIWSEV